MVLFEQIPNILCPLIYETFLCPLTLSFLSKYLLLCVTRTRVIFFQKLQCVGPMPEKMQVPVKLFLYSFCVHIKILVTTGVTLICS